MANSVLVAGERLDGHVDVEAGQTLELLDHHC